MRVSKSRLINFIVFFLITVLGLTAKAEAAGINTNKACVVMDSYQVSNAAVIPGEDFNLTLVLRNPSNTQNVNGIILSFASDMETVAPIYGQSNQYYLDTILAGERKEVTITLHANDNITTSDIKFQIDLSYANTENAANTDQISIQIPVTTNSNIEIQNVSLPDKVNADSKARFYVTYKNTGIDDLYNVSMNISNQTTNDAKQVSLGSLLASKVGYGEAYLNFKSMGEQKIQITFTYEDVKGAKYTTDPFESAITVVENADEETSESDNGNADGKSSDMNYEKIVLLVGIIIFGIVSVVLLKRLKK